jgi:hypothetical protein
VIFGTTGKRGALERRSTHVGGLPRFELVALLPGLELGPRIADNLPTAERATRGRFTEHFCPVTARSFSAANFNRKPR